MSHDPVSDYVRWMRARGLSAGLVNRRSAQLRAAELIMGVPLQRATPSDITALVERGRHRGLADSTLYVYAGHLRAFYEWANTQGVTRRNPIVGAAVPRRPRYLPRPIAEADLSLAVTTAEPRARIILCLAGLAGLRAVEIARLRREDVLDHNEPPLLLVQGKGDKPRAVPLSAPLLTELHAYGMPNRGPIIRRCDGLNTHVSPSLVSSVANAHLHGIGIPDTLHSLRHRAGTVLYRKTRDIRLTQDVLGHASPATTAIYAAWSQEDAPRAMEQLALPLLCPSPAVI